MALEAFLLAAFAQSSLIFGIVVTTGDPISIALVAAVWISNVPQAMAPSADLAEQGWSFVLTDSLVPFSFQKAGRPAGIFTVIGFAVILLLI